LVTIYDTTAPTITVKAGYVGNLENKTFSNVSFQLHDANKVDKYVLNSFTSDFTNNNWSDANFQNIKSHLVQGSNTLTLYDVAGNSTSYSFTYDSVGPTATISSYNGTDTTPTLSGTVSEPTAILTVKIDGGTAASATNNGDGTWNYTVPTSLTAGSHTVTLVASDTAGNSYQTTANVVVEAPRASQTGISNSTNRGNSNNATGHQSTVTVTPNNDGRVLGASTEVPSTSTTGEVKGDSTTLPKVNFANDSAVQKDLASKNSSNVLGLGWWWIAVLAVIVGFFLFVLRKSSSDKA
jgi:hypothetical protein